MNVERRAGGVQLDLRHPHAAGRDRAAVDGKGIDVPGSAFLRHLLMRKLDKTEIGALLHEFKLVTKD